MNETYKLARNDVFHSDLGVLSSSRSLVLSAYCRMIGFSHLLNPFQACNISRLAVLRLSTEHPKYVS